MIRMERILSSLGTHLENNWTRWTEHSIRLRSDESPTKAVYIGWLHYTTVWIIVGRGPHSPGAALANLEVEMDWML